MIVKNNMEQPNENIKFEIFCTNCNNLLDEINKIDENFTGSEFSKTSNSKKCLSVLVTIKNKLLKLQNENFNAELNEKKHLLIEVIKEKFYEKVQIFKTIENNKNNKLKTESIKKIKLVSPNITNENLEIACKYPEEFVRMKIESNSTDTAIIQKFKTEKYNETIELENQIKELYQLTIEFGLIITDHSVKLDNIENGIINTIDNVDDAIGNITKSEILLQKIRTKKCCLMTTCVIIMIIIIGIILIVVFIGKNNF